MQQSVDSRVIEQFIASPIDQDLVQRLIVKTLQVIPCASSNDVPDNRKLPSLSKFLARLINHLNLNNGTLMCTLLYMNRLRSKLPKNCKGLPSTRHRILLSCLILAIKFTNDFSLKNHDWLSLTNRLFNLRDINLMERQLLFLLNWNLNVTEKDLFTHFYQFLGPIKETVVNNYRMKQYLRKQKQMQPVTPKQSARSDAYSPAMSAASSPSSPMSLASLSGGLHSRQDSLSSIESYEDFQKVNPMIEMAAQNEEYELNVLLKSFNHQIM